MKREIKLVVLAIILFIIHFIASKFSIINSNFLGGCFLGATQAWGVISILEAVFLYLKRRKKTN